MSKMTRLSVPTVHGWKTIPIQHCPAIEMATNGQYTCEQLRPDSVWKREVDPSWPNPGGRPLLDFFETSEAKKAEVL